MKRSTDYWLDEMEMLMRGGVGGKIEERPAKLNNKPITVFAWDFGCGSIIIGQTRGAADWSITRMRESMNKRVGSIVWG